MLWPGRHAVFERRERESDVVSEQERNTWSVQTVTSETNSQITRTVLRLREMILSGEFSPGERVSEAPLTGRLGASRTPIRLALERLAHEGLLDPYPTGGFIVRTFTLEDVWDGIEVRGVLEGAAARLAAERLTSDGELDTRCASARTIWTR